MQFYEYRCMACRHLFTVRRSMADRNKVTYCPECNKGARRVISKPQDFRHVWATPKDPEELRRTEEIWP